MKLRLLLILVIVLIAVPHISAVDAGGWQNVTVNNVTFKIPEKFSNGRINDLNTGYSQGKDRFFHINSLVRYDTLKSIYGITSASGGIENIEEREIAGHDAVVVYNHNDFHDYDYLDVFFTTGNKIFRIQYPSSNVTPELVEMINSTPKSQMSKDAFLNKLDNAQRDYSNEEYQKNLELDFEDYYRSYNDQNRHNSFWYFGSNGYGFGVGTRW